MNVDISVISEVVLMMFFVLIVGFVARKLKWVNETTAKQISQILMKVAQPLLIISSQIKVEYSAENLKNGAIVFLIGLGVHGLLSVLAYFACMWFKNPNKRKISEYALIFSNCGFIGYPVLEALLGPIGVFYASFYIITFNIFTWTWGMAILGRGREDIKINLRGMIVNYGTVSSFVGLALYISRLPIPAFIVDGMSSLGAVCTPLSVFLCGMLLATRTMRQLFTRPRVYYTALLKLIVFPLIVTLVAKLIGLPTQMIYIASILSALPTAANTVMFTEIYDIEQGYAAQIVGTTTALCVGTVPLVVYLTNLIVAW